MTIARLSPLDAAFLDLEKPNASMHVGWVALFGSPDGEPAPDFDRIRDHIAGRLVWSPRYRQKLARVPFQLNRPVWIDDPDFDSGHHIRQATAPTLTEAVEQAMSEPLDRDRPLWEMSVFDRLDDGRIAVIGKAHHCMVDGLAMVQLAALLLDPTPEPQRPQLNGWHPQGPPAPIRLLSEGIEDRVRQELGLVRGAFALRSPRQAFGFAKEARRAARALTHALAPTHPRPPINASISPHRHLALARRPLTELRRIKDRYGATINDVLLAASAGAIRRLFQRLGEPPVPLKAMVPVSLRAPGEELGNRIAFVFVSLPCDEPDPVRQLRLVSGAMGERKQAGEARGAEAVLRGASHLPSALQRSLAQLTASPRAFNVTVSNIPGPAQPLYMLGCRLEEAYPAVPVADGHTFSIGMTTIGEGAFFGVYADSAAPFDSDLLAEDIDSSIEELLEPARRDAPVLTTA